jgi:5-dehydro-4-deoxyglucarate dehydratase
MKDYSELIQRLRGPVYPVLPAFRKNGELDLEATHDYIDTLVSRGAGALIVTAGSSRLNLLDFDEVAALNECLVRACNGRALAIAGNPAIGSTAVTAKLMHSAERAGADAFLAVYSERYYGDAPVVEYFTALSQETAMALLVHTIPMRMASAGPTQVQTYSLDLIGQIAELPNIVGMKEESGNEVLRQQTVQRFDKVMPIILAGGAMRNCLGSWPFGAGSWLVGIGNFIPELENRFHAHMLAGEIAEACSIVFDQELPYFNVAVPIGWHTALKATLSLFDLMPPYERAPLPQPSAREVEALRAICQKLGWLA